MRPFTTIMEDHSEAKIKLYSTYLSRYLNILSRSYIKKIYLYDVFCGEGIYADGGKGSPVVTLECIKNHYFSNSNTCPNISVVFNDSEKSEIEPSKYKSSRVEELTSNIFKPSNVKTYFEHFDYSELIKKIINKAQSLQVDERALVFIDPQGYKEIKPKDLEALLDCKKVEVLLFLPIHFMYRFANKAMVDINFKGGRAIRELLDEIYSGSSKPYYRNEQHFITELHTQFKKYLGMDFVDVFKIERSDNQWFAMFFFTHNRKGFWKMLDAKWKVDGKGGKAFKQSEPEGLMFSEYEHSGYKQIVFDYLVSNPSATNDDLLLLGLKNNFLPTHTLSIIKEINKTHPIQVLSQDGKAALGYYIGDEKRKVIIRFKYGSVNN